MNRAQSRSHGKGRSVSALCQGPRYFDPELLDEQEAGRFYHRCIKALGSSAVNGQASGILRVGCYHAQIYAIYSGPGRLLRFWLRTLSDNRLVIVGNRNGLLPLDVESIHG